MKIVNFVFAFTLTAAGIYMLADGVVIIRRLLDLQEQGVDISAAAGMAEGLCIVGAVIACTGIVLWTMWYYHYEDVERPPARHLASPEVTAA